MDVYVEAVHRVTPFRPDVFDRWVQFYDQVAIPIMTRHGYDVVGVWRRLTGGAGEDVILNRFDSLAAFEEISNDLFRDPALAEGIGALRAEMPEIGIQETVKIAHPPPGTPQAEVDARLQAARDASASGRHYYLQVHSRSAALPDLAERVATAGGGETGRRLVALYQSRIGLRDELTSIWMLDGAATAPASGTPPPFGGDLAHEEQVTLLSALPYSPLQ